MKYIKFILLPIFFWSTFAFNQLVDFENLPNSLPGVVVGELTAPNSTCSIEFFCGKDLETTSPLTLQKLVIKITEVDFMELNIRKIAMENKFQRDGVTK